MEVMIEDLKPGMYIQIDLRGQRGYREIVCFIHKQESGYKLETTRGVWFNSKFDKEFCRKYIIL